MTAITLSGQVGPDHRLTIELPPSIPPGTVEVTVRTSELPDVNLAREAARAKLLAAGRLVTDIYAPADMVELSDIELRRLITVSPGMPSLDEMIDQDRGPR